MEKNKTALAQETYRRLLLQICRAKESLEEYTQAIREFHLDDLSCDPTPVQCRAGLLAPQEIIDQAISLAEYIKALTQYASIVELTLLQETKDLSAYVTGAEIYLDIIDDAV